MFIAPPWVQIDANRSAGYANNAAPSRQIAGLERWSALPMSGASAPSGPSQRR